MTVAGGAGLNSGSVAGLDFFLPSRMGLTLGAVGGGMALTPCPPWGPEAMGN